MTKTMKSVLLAGGLTLAAMAPAQAQGFEGAYGGIYAGARIPTVTPWLGGVQVGYNFSLGSAVIVGIEGDVGVFNTGMVATTASARLGYAVGSNVMLYGSLGIGSTSTPTTYYQIGGGGEFNVTDNVYLRAQVDRLMAFSGGPALYLGKVGVGYRF